MSPRPRVALSPRLLVSAVLALTLLGNGVALALVGVPPGEFFLGSTKEEQAWALANGVNEQTVRNEGESSRNAKIAEGFWIGRTEVTTGQWKPFVKETGYVTDAEKKGEIGFRVVQGELPSTEPLPPLPPPRNAREVSQTVPAGLKQGPAPARPCFFGPRQYVYEPTANECPVFARHNHCPAIVNCANGDRLAIWYTCRIEPGRELGIVASRLRYGETERQPASDFWDTPDRNDHASALWGDQQGTLYHFNGLSAAGTWGSLATILRTSEDHGATWSNARLIMPEHGLHHMPIESVLRTREGVILVPCDAVPGGSGGSVLLASRDDGRTWEDLGEGQPPPDFRDGGRGAFMAGIHAGFVQLTDGRLLAFGRGNNIDGRMPQSISEDLGKTWTYSASPFPGLGGGQRLAILRLQEGPILFCSFGTKVTVTDASGKPRAVSGLFAALSYDAGRREMIRSDGGHNNLPVSCGVALLGTPSSGIK